MVFVRVCGKVFDSLETHQKLQSYQIEQFFQTLKFLFNQKVSDCLKLKLTEMIILCWEMATYELKS